MPTIGKNFAANLIGSAWSAALTLIVLPIYLRMLGAELYGLVGLYTAAQLLFLVLDLGLGASVNREMARLPADGAGVASPRHLLKTLGVIYWCGAGLIALTMLLGAHFLATFWLHPVHATNATVSHALMTMGLVLALQFPFGLYSGALFGLQRHVEVNACVVAGATLRLLLPIPALLWSPRDISLFFAIQAGAAALQTFGAKMLLNRALPALRRERSRFNGAELRRLRGFATGMSAVTVLAVALIQMDRLILSRVVSLEELGYYSVAAAAASGLGVISIPAQMTTFPRFAQLIAAGRTDEVHALYHFATKAVAALLLPLAAIMIVFSHRLLLLWTGNPVVAARGGSTLSFLALAIAASSLSYVAQALQFADGWTQFAVRLNAVGVIALIPSMWFAAGAYGGTGVAIVYALWSVICFGVTVRVMRRRMSGGQHRDSVLRDVLFSLAASSAVALVAKHVCAGIEGRAAVAAIAISGLLAMIASVAAMPALWRPLLHRSISGG